MNDFILRHDEVLRSLVLEADIPAQRIKDAMLYSLFPGGKRIRPQLVYLCGDLLNVAPEVLDILAAAIELIHGYSLIHDDLPAMDNDDYRRGKLTCHRAFDEETAILAGDGMQALAIDILLTHLPKTLPPHHVLQVTHALVKAAGPQGMISGQSLDLSELSHGLLDEQTLQTIHHLKTGQLILACVSMVLKTKNSDEEHVHALETFAHHLGLVFQMQDDYLDRYNEDDLGKKRASDEANHKTTFATLYSQDNLLTIIHTRFTQAHEALSPFKDKAQKLHDLLDALAMRTQIMKIT
ncbi:MAG: polyprenyl synthetase family protein [Legionellaceae bacterium]